MQTTQQMFFETIYDAFKAGVDWCGGPKAVGARLWPTIDPDDAGRKLRACINPERAEKFSEDERIALLRLFREKGFHGVMQKQNEILDYEPPKIIAPRTTAQHLAEKMEHHLREFRRLADEHAAALTASELRAVK